MTNCITHKNLSLRSRTLHLARSKCVTTVLLCALLTVTSSAALAAEATPSAEDLPTVHILPDNPLYFLKTLKEKVQLIIVRSASGQADLLLKFAQKRLAEALKVAEKGKVHISEKLFDAFGRDIKAAQEKIAQARAAGEQTRDLLVKLQETVAYQKSVVEKMQEEALFYSSEVQERIEALNSFLVQVDEGLGVPPATESGKIQTRQPEKTSGLGIGNWLRSLFGKKEVLSPIAE